MPELHEGKPFNPYKHFHNAWVPTSLLSAEGLSDGAKLLYGLLRKYAGKDGNCFPLQRTLALNMRRPERTIRKYLRELRKAQLVKTVRRGKGRAVRYEFLWKSCLNPVQLSLEEVPENAYNVGTKQPTEEVQVSGSPYINSSRRACGNVEIFDSAPVSEAVEGNQEEAGTSEQSGGIEDGYAVAGRLAKAGWKVLRLGNGTPPDTNAAEGLRMRDSIRELAWSKRMDRRASRV